MAPKIVQYFQKRTSLIELGYLNLLREYNNICMVCQAYLNLLRLSQPGEMCNIASVRVVSLRTIISFLEGITQRAINLEVNPAFVRENDIAILSRSATKIETLLSPLSHPLLEDTLSWMVNSSAG